ncbi:hypothetical protein B0T21DRAFT_416643 [Apiosordaria backusii]|uniref:Uncharacterized protein n=1 Tax=Apiosordaria backusii TaxID=314023 RepID=A0AA40DJY0_9PEZI|nr:hypothetical protein B0T21DRAFT_416643 [Apiosordaria backusii]
MPDLNSVPPSPHFLSRRTSQQMPPPPAPSSLVLPSNQAALNNPNSTTTPVLPSPQFPPMISPLPGSTMAGDNTGVGSGPGPVRHPRPPTAAELHSELEKEQEARINRLTRELATLRALHNESVVSNASSTSATGTEPGDPRSARHIRTLSNTSTRSNMGSVSTTSMAGISSPAPIRPSPHQPLGGVTLSRQGSSASRRTGSPAPLGLYGSSYSNEPTLANYFSSRVPHGSSSTSVLATPGSTSDLSPGLIPATDRYQETAFYREQLEATKRENEELKKRVRELERMVRDRRGSDVSAGGATPGAGASRRVRSDSVSTTTSVAASVATSATGAGGISVAAQRSRPRITSATSGSQAEGGALEQEVRVGESASSSGLQRGVDFPAR